VISNYRESLLTAFPDPSIISKSIHYPTILRRVYDLLPKSPGADLAKELYEDMVLPASRPLQTSSGVAKGTVNRDEPFAAPLQTTTHALHLSPEGKIDPHVDNIDASGSVIVGVSLGGERILRLEQDAADRKERGGSAGWEVLLPSGSVYVQK
jgi:alkylated DNA repair protein alkB family protein 7